MTAEAQSLTRTSRWTTLALLLAWAWLAMTITHELGHVIGGLASGAQLTAIEIRPWCLPHTLFSPDPKPLVTLWAGPILGCGIPLLVAMLIRTPAVLFVVWFCLLANASYLLLGTFVADAELDSQKLIKAGTPMFIILLFVAMIGPVSYVAFREQCVQLISNPDRPLNKRHWRISATALLGVTIVQSIAGTVLAS